MDFPKKVDGFPKKSCWIRQKKLMKMLGKNVGKM